MLETLVEDDCTARFLMVERNEIDPQTGDSVVLCFGFLLKDDKPSVPETSCPYLNRWSLTEFMLGILLKYCKLFLALFWYKICEGRAHPRKVFKYRRLFLHDISGYLDLLMTSI